MARIPATDAYAMRAKVHELRADGKSLRDIAARLDLSVGSVRNYLASPLPSVDPAPVKAAALVIKRGELALGPQSVLDGLRQQFADLTDTELPGEATIGRWFKAENLSRKALTFSIGSRAYWHEDRPTGSLQRCEIDTVKLHVAGRLVEVITATDWFSHLVWAEAMDDKSFGRYLPWFLSRCFAAMGVPDTIQVDNGFGFILPRRAVLSKFCRYAFSEGVKKIEYIPVAEAQRNGRIESFNGWLKDQWLRCPDRDVMTMAAFREWLADALYRYNVLKSHRALSARRKGGYRRPADVGAYNHLPVAVPELVAVPSSVQAGTVAYKRLVYERGEAFVNAPAMVFLLSRALHGHYVTLELPIGGLGRVLWAEYDRLAQTAVVHEIGTFEHELMGVVTGGFIKVDLTRDGFEPIPFDLVRKMEHDRKHLKQARRPGYLPAGFTLEDAADGGWLIYDEDGELVYSDQCSQVDHAAEVLPVD
jgi:hypothetical protein